MKDGSGGRYCCWRQATTNDGRPAGGGRREGATHGKRAIHRSSLSGKGDERNRLVFVFVFGLFGFVLSWVVRLPVPSITIPSTGPLETESTRTTLRRSLRARAGGRYEGGQTRGYAYAAREQERRVDAIIDRIPNVCRIPRQMSILRAPSCVKRRQFACLWAQGRET